MPNLTSNHQHVGALRILSQRILRVTSSDTHILRANTLVCIQLNTARAALAPKQRLHHHFNLRRLRPSSLGSRSHLSNNQSLTYHRVPLKLHQSEATLGAVKEDRLMALADMRMFGKIAESDLLLIQGAVLCKPTAIFRGLKRPMSVPGYPPWYREDRVLTLVCKPSFGVDASSGKPNRCDPPATSVFVAYLRRVDDDGQRDQIRRNLAADHQTVYLIYHWEWVLSDAVMPELPEDHATRYSEKMPWP